jgi:hypothetical protein
MKVKQFSDFLKHLKNYSKLGLDMYYQKGYSRSYTEKEVIEHFIKKYDRK